MGDILLKMGEAFESLPNIIQWAIVAFIIFWLIKVFMIPFHIEAIREDVEYMKKRYTVNSESIFYLENAMRAFMSLVYYQNKEDCDAIIKEAEEAEKERTK